jgi:hypothetical protein
MNARVARRGRPIILPLVHDRQRGSFPLLASLRSAALPTRACQPGQIGGAGFVGVRVRRRPYWCTCRPGWAGGGALMLGVDGGAQRDVVAPQSDLWRIGRRRTCRRSRRESCAGSDRACHLWAAPASSPRPRGGDRVPVDSAFAVALPGCGLLRAVAGSGGGASVVSRIRRGPCRACFAACVH